MKDELRSDPKQIALDMAKESECNKRKVGACIVDANGKVVATGCNHNPMGDCEDAAGATEANVIHAEMAAVHELHYDQTTVWQNPLTIYTTHAPCADCRAGIEEAGIRNIVVVETFMKFDTDKLRFDLVPTDWHRGDAEILTFGAKKYKPNNWREVDDLGRYFAALERHLLACREAYENNDLEALYDEETGLHHMKHLRTNAGFLLTLLEKHINENNN